MTNFLPLLTFSQSILKSMIGKDMTKMTLPVSFNEPTSLLQRCAEDMVCFVEQAPVAHSH